MVAITCLTSRTWCLFKLKIYINLFSFTDSPDVQSTTRVFFSDRFALEDKLEIFVPLEKVIGFSSSCPPAATFRRAKTHLSKTIDAKGQVDL